MQIFITIELIIKIFSLWGYGPLNEHLLEPFNTGMEVSKVVVNFEDSVDYRYNRTLLVSRGALIISVEEISGVHEFSK